MLKFMLELCQLFDNSLAFLALDLIFDGGDGSMDVVDDSSLMVSEIRAGDSGVVLE